MVEKTHPAKRWEATKPGEILPAAVMAELDRIVGSAAFAKVERPARFLRHCVETALRDEPQLLKETVVGVDVFGRPASWDPRIDPIVRQEAARLRKRLARYYSTEDAGAEVRIELPVGTCVPEFQKATGIERQEPGETAVPVMPEIPAPPDPEHSADLRRWSKPPRKPLLAAGALICAAVAAVLAWYLIPKPPSSLRPPKSDAEDFYLRGMYYWEKRTPESLTQAVDLFTQSIVSDPRYARAYVGLANSYNLLREFSAMPEREAFPRALAATQQALELDDRSSEAHSSLAFISFWWNWNAAAADREFQRAISLDPNQVTAHHWYATFLYARGRHLDALDQINIAQRLEPTSASVLADKGLILYFADRREGAMTLLRQLEAEDPTLQSSQRYLALIYLAERDYPDYLAELKRGAVLSKSEVSQAIAAATENGYAAGGGKGMLQSVLETQTAFHRKGLMPSYYLAETCGMLGRTSDAVRYLEASSEESLSLFPCYRIDPAFRDLRSDPVYQKLDASFEPKIAAGTFPVRR